MFRRHNRHRAAKQKYGPTSVRTLKEIDPHVVPSQSKRQRSKKNRNFISIQSSHLGRRGLEDIETKLHEVLKRKVSVCHPEFYTQLNYSSKNKWRGWRDALARKSVCCSCRVHLDPSSHTGCLTAAYNSSSVFWTLRNCT